MIDAKKIQQLDVAFQRILTLPVSKSTFRQMQNAVLFCFEGDRDAASKLLETILAGKSNSTGAEQERTFQKFVDRHSLPMSVAREVAERGDFLSIVTSDIISHPEMPIFGNRIRRVDGQEFDFITNAETAVQLLHHFSARLAEMEKLEKSRDVLKGFKKELVSLKTRIDQLIQNSSE